MIIQHRHNNLGAVEALLGLRLVPLLNQRHHPPQSRLQLTNTEPAHEVRRAPLELVPGASGARLEESGVVPGRRELSHLIWLKNGSSPFRVGRSPGF